MPQTWEWEEMADEEEEDLPPFTWDEEEEDVSTFTSILFEGVALVFLLCWEFVALLFTFALAFIGFIFNTDSIMWLLEYVVF